MSDKGFYKVIDDTKCFCFRFVPRPYYYGFIKKKILPPFGQKTLGDNSVMSPRKQTQNWDEDTLERN